MFTMTAKLVGVSPLSFSAPVSEKKKGNESHDEHEERTWQMRAHVDDNGELFIPPMALKNMLANVAKHLSEKIPGKRNATFTKHFLSGLQVVDPMRLGIKKEDVEQEKLFVPADGKRGGGTRVWRSFPTVKSWETNCTIFCLDPEITPTKLEEYLGQAGQLIGLLRFRPQNGGYYGRFRVEDVEHEEGIKTAI